MATANHFILSSLMKSAIKLVAAANAIVSSESNSARGVSAGADTPRAQLNFSISIAGDPQKPLSPSPS